MYISPKFFLSTASSIKKWACPWAETGNDGWLLTPSKVPVRRPEPQNTQVFSWSKGTAYKVEEHQPLQMQVLGRSTTPCSPFVRAEWTDREQFRSCKKSCNWEVCMIAVGLKLHDWLEISDTPATTTRVPSIFWLKVAVPGKKKKTERQSTDIISPKRDPKVNMWIFQHSRRIWKRANTAHIENIVGMSNYIQGVMKWNRPEWARRLRLIYRKMGKQTDGSLSRKHLLLKVWCSHPT